MSKKVFFDLKKFKHVESDDKTATLQHPDGHKLTIAKKALAPEFRAQLDALGKTSKQDKTKMAYGDEVPRWDHSKGLDKPYPSKDYHDKTTPEQDQQRRNQMDADDASFRKNNPTTEYADGGNVADKKPAPPSDPNADWQAQAETAKKNTEDPQSIKAIYSGGGKVHNEDISTQGLDVRHAKKARARGDENEAQQGEHFAREEAKGRAQFEREAVKPNLKRLANGGPTEGLPCRNPNCKSEGKPHPNCRCYSRMAEGGEVDHVCASGNKHYPDCEYYAEGSPEGVQPNEDSDRSAPHQFFKEDAPETEDSKNKGIDKEVEDAENYINPQAQKPAPAPMQDESQPNQQAQQPQAQQPQYPQEQQQPQEPQEESPKLSQPGEGKETSNPIERFATHKQQIQNDYMNEDSAWAQDLANGHITPMTYESMFANKSTTGKLGTIFGMLMSGAGSGLAHQPNALLAMMNQTINNDLEAQKQSKSNSVNYLRLAQQHEMNKAGINHMNAETSIAANTLTRMRANRAALQSLVAQVNTMPPGSPQRQAADANLAMLNQYVQNDNMNLADRAATAGAYYRMLGVGSGDSKEGSEEAFQQQQRGRIMLGPQGEKAANMAIDRHIPGISGQASRPIPEDIRNRLQAQTVLDNKGQDVLNYIQKHTGTWNPQTRAVAQQKIEEMKNFYNDSIKGGALTQGRLGWYDEQFAKHPTDILSQLMGSTAKLKEMVNSNRNRRDLELSGPGGLGFPKQKQQEQPQEQFKEGATGTHKGKPTVFKGGKWVYQ